MVNLMVMVNVIRGIGNDNGKCSGNCIITL